IRLGEQCFENCGAKTTSGDAANREEMRRKVRILILNSAQHGRSPISSTNSAAFGGNDVKRMLRLGLIVFLHQIVPFLERFQNIESTYFLQRSSPNDMVVVPVAEKNAQQDEDGDNWKLPTTAQVNKQTANGDPRGRSQKQYCSHAQPLRHSNRIGGEENEKQ